jgi:hypothetical protein
MSNLVEEHCSEISLNKVVASRYKSGSTKLKSINHTISISTDEEGWDLNVKYDFSLSQSNNIFPSSIAITCDYGTRKYFPMIFTDQTIDRHIERHKNIKIKTQLSTACVTKVFTSSTKIESIAMVEQFICAVHTKLRIVSNKFDIKTLYSRFNFDIYEETELPTSIVVCAKGQSVVYTF